MAIKAIVLDLDGTLYRAAASKAADSGAINRVHIYLEREKVINKVGKRSIHYFQKRMDMGVISMTIRHLSRKCNLDQNKFNKFVYGSDPAKFGIKRDQSLIDLLTPLSKKYPIFICTNSPMIWASKVVRILGLAKLIGSAWIISLEDMGGYLKPEKGAFRLMLTKLNLKHDEIIFLDDNARNIAVAKSMGITSFRVENEGIESHNSIYSVLDRLTYKLLRANKN
ncbi:MAG: HAD family hydrolase [Candidatus Micrarchaeota archaeon]|nr:HAD family hydrolase [Candidatus Micrarchaeota archaeon]